MDIITFFLALAVCLIMVGYPLSGGLLGLYSVSLLLCTLDMEDDEDE